MIMITNDDSVNAKGLTHLIDCAAEFGDVIVVAPAHPHSGQSSALTVGAPLMIDEKPDYNGARVFSVTGTPVDCVKLALSAIVPRKPVELWYGHHIFGHDGCRHRRLHRRHPVGGLLAAPSFA